MKYRISTDYQQPAGPPRWEYPGQHRAHARKTSRAHQEPSPEPSRNGRTAQPKRQAPDRALRGRVLLAHGLVHAHASAGTALRPHSGAHVLRRLLVRHHGDQRRPRLSPGPPASPSSGAGCIQPSVVRKKDGTLVAYLRDNGPAAQARAHQLLSKDDGVSGRRRATPRSPIRAPASRAIRLRTATGSWCTTTSRRAATRWSPPSPTTKARPGNGSGIWMAGPPRRSTASITTRRVIQARDGSIHVTYSYFVPEGKSIKHVRFNEAWVKAGD